MVSAQLVQGSHRSLKESMGANLLSLNSPKDIHTCKPVYRRVPIPSGGADLPPKK
jgi:hypothetical protein